MPYWIRVYTSYKITVRYYQGIKISKFGRLFLFFYDALKNFSNAQGSIWR